MSFLARRTLLATIALCALVPLPAVADPLPPPEGEVLLTVSGAGSGDSVPLDLALLQSLPQTTYETETIWTVGTQTFTGVTLKALMERLDGTGKGLRAHAINNYAIDIPWADVADGSALIAHHRNGATMSVREKGPLWLVYPYDSDARFRQETYHARSIWQLDRIDVLP